jgi:GT2 family glycosyltransferase
MNYDFDFVCSLVLYNTEYSELKNVIECINKSKKIYKIVLVDNSPSNDLENIKNEFKGIDYFFVGDNIGYGAGHNIAFKKYNKLTKYNIVLNSDLIFNGLDIDNLFEFMEKNMDIAHVMPKIKFPNGDIQYLCKFIPTPIDLLIRRFLPKKYQSKMNIKYEMRNTGYNKIMDVPYLSGCFMFLRSSVLEEIGYFDDRFFMYPEDIDLTRRINEKYRTVFYPYVTVIHNHNKMSYKSPKMLNIHISNIIKYFNKWGWLFDKKRKIQNMRTIELLKSKDIKI